MQQAWSTPDSLSANSRGTMSDKVWTANRTQPTFSQLILPKCVEMASAGDAAEILSIYAPFCATDCAVSFEYGPPSLEEMTQRIVNTTTTHPWLVWKEGGIIAGYAYAAPHKQRAAYNWSVDTSIYLRPSHHRKGIGKKLYLTLLELLKNQGFVNAYAGVTLPNEGSVALHKSVGFVDLTVYRKVGFKNDKWHDVAWFEQTLIAHTNEQPKEPLTIRQILQL